MSIGRALKKLIKLPGKLVSAVLPGTGRSAARRAEQQANEFSAQAQSQIAQLEEERKKSRAKAQKLQIRALRSRRSASYYQAAPTGGSETIG